MRAVFVDRWRGKLNLEACTKDCGYIKVVAIVEPLYLV